MSSLISLQPSNNNFDIYLKEINAGIIQIPEFQRDFIWDLENVINLLKSIKKNYPIGSFLFWRPETQFKVAKQIGPYFIKDEFISTFEKINCKYVLDGYQRMSSLFGALTNPENIHNFTKNQDLYNSTFNIYYNLKEQEFENYRGKERERESYIVPVFILLDFEGFLTISQKIQNDYETEISNLYTSRLKKIVTTFERYQMPVIEIAGGTLEEAIDIFTLLNKEGKPITPDWILSAKTYTSDFRLGDKIDETLEKLESYNFTDKRPKEIAVRELIFRSIQSSFGNLYLDNKKTDILILSKKNGFKNQVERTIESIEIAVKFLFEELLIVDNKLLPASMQFIFLVEFFNHNRNPNQNEIEQLKKWFWITSFSNYFTIYSPSKRKEAFKYFQSFSSGLDDLVIYRDKQNFLFSVPELPNKVNLGAVRSKSRILYMLNYSNNFIRIDFNYVQDYKIFRLLSDISSDLINRYGESSNMIVCLNKVRDNVFNIQGKKVKDLSILLRSEFKGMYSEFFINDEMREQYAKGNIEAVLRMRSKLISDNEKFFYRDLGLIDYEMPF
jgi:uncharacterized protein with ParB-like and HNH nuclease domain